MKTDRRPVAVLESDVHYTLQTMKEADAATRQAIDKANELQVPLVIAGDLHDTKANMRGECMNCMIETFRYAQRCGVQIILMVGNHDKINEKGEAHSLGFLEPYCELIDTPKFTNNIAVEDFYKRGGAYSVHLIPYHSDVDALRRYLIRVEKGSTVIMHQGVRESDQTNMIDPTAITLADVSELRVISGHYHSREQIENPHGGLWDFIGNPYTFSFGEAHDPEKGFQILYNDGSLEFVPTNLRSHVIMDLHIESLDEFLRDMVHDHTKPNDLVWIKIRGSLEQLSSVTRGTVAKWFGRDTFKLDLTPIHADEVIPQRGITSTERFDSIIDALEASHEKKQSLKELWRKLLT